MPDVIYFVFVSLFLKGCYKLSFFAIALAASGQKRCVKQQRYSCEAGARVLLFCSHVVVTLSVSEELPSALSLSLSLSLSLFLCLCTCLCLCLSLSRALFPATTGCASIRSRPLGVLYLVCCGIIFWRKGEPKIVEVSYEFKP